MVFFVIITISYFYMTNMQEYIKKSSLVKLEILGSAANDKIDLYVQQQQDKVELFNTRKYLYNKLIEYEKEKSSKIKSIIEDILKFSYTKEEDIIDIVILDSDSDIIASKLKKVTSKNSFLNTLKNMPTASPKTKLVFETIKTAPLLYISVPLFKDKRLIGTSVFILKLIYLNSMLINEETIGKTGEILLGAKSADKLLIFTPLKETSYPKVCLNQDFVDYIFAKDNLDALTPQTVEQTLDYRKELVALSLHHNKTLKVMILVKQDMAELMKPLRKIQLKQLLVLFIGSVFILLAGLLISNKMVKIIENVVRITSNISNGRLDERIDITTKDELGTLARSVNKMADFMVNANAISEAKVIEKTGLLQESNSELKRISLQLEETVLELRQNNQSLSTIIKSLSHDIKTPLTIINGYLEEIDDGLVECEEIPKVTAILKKETAYLNELASEVIGYIQSKELTTNKKEKILLKEFLDTEVCPLLRVDDGVVLKCEIGDEDSIVFNRTALKKILINLLHNASKYTTNGHITTKVKNNTIVIEDTGIGIDLHFSRTVFEPFVSLDESRNREKNGFGLGLSIASNLAKSNGYKLELDNSYNAGCRFVLERLDKIS